MTDMPETSYIPTPHRRRPARPVAAFRIEEAFWGYSIVPQGMPPLGLVVMQLTMMICGAALVAASGVLMIVAAPAEILFRLPAVLVIGALGVALTWCASRGVAIQVEVDTMNGEVREVVRNRTGARTTLTRYGIDCIGGVFIQRREGASRALVLRYRNTARTMTVATGSDAALARLRDRLGRDLIVNREGR